MGQCYLKMGKMKKCFILSSNAEHFLPALKGAVLPRTNREGKRYFPDGEIYVKLPEAKKMKGKRVIVVHSGLPRPNDGLIELELILEILKEHKIKPEVFFTYFPYGRQDEVFEEGETNAAKAIVQKLTDYYRVKKIYAIDCHFGKKNWVKKIPIFENVSAVPFLMKRARRDWGEDILFLATDQGGQRRFNLPGFEKKRKNSFQVEVFLPEPLAEKIKGKSVCLVDDLIGTGTTLLKIGQLVKKYGAKKLLCLAVHNTLAKGAKKIKKKFDKIYLTNTINNPGISQIDITPLILKAIRKT